MLTPHTILQNRYRIVRQLGQGGMGTVYEAIDERLDTTIALKETHFTDERLRKQFEREARLLARLRHPAMTRVIDHFSEGDGQFLVMDFISGEDLWEMMQKNGGRFPVDKVLEWGDQLLDALDYLHKQEPPIIHRDIKPQNLKLSHTGQIILLDFGLAKGFAGQISRVTPSGSIFGYTPNYAPLEQMQGTGTDSRSDFYSLAATLYHMITGLLPPDSLSRASANVNEQPDPLRPVIEITPDVSVHISNVLEKALAQNPSKRFANATEMRLALQKARAFETTTLPRKIPETPNAIEGGKAQSNTSLPLPSTLIDVPSEVLVESTPALTPMPQDVSPSLSSELPAIASSSIASSANGKSNQQAPSRLSRKLIGFSLIVILIAVFVFINMSSRSQNPTSDFAPTQTKQTTIEKDKPLSILSDYKIKIYYYSRDENNIADASAIRARLVTYGLKEGQFSFYGKDDKFFNTNAGTPPNGYEIRYTQGSEDEAANALHSILKEVGYGNFQMVKSETRPDKTLSIFLGLEPQR